MECPDSDRHLEVTFERKTNSFSQTFKKLEFKKLLVFQKHLASACESYTLYWWDKDSLKHFGFIYPWTQVDESYNYKIMGPSFFWVSHTHTGGPTNRIPQNYFKALSWVCSYSMIHFPIFPAHSFSTRHFHSTSTFQVVVWSVAPSIALTWHINHFRAAVKRIKLLQWWSLLKKSTYWWTIYTCMYRLAWLKGSYVNSS